MPKSKYVTITLTENEAELVSAEVSMAAMVNNNDSRRRADLARAAEKIEAACACGHNKPPGGALVTMLVVALEKAIEIDGRQDEESRNIPHALRRNAEALIAGVRGTKPAARVLQSATQWSEAELEKIRKQGPQGPPTINRINTTEGGAA